MKPPEAPPRVADSHAGLAVPAVSVCAVDEGRDRAKARHRAPLGKLRKRPEFLRVARGRKSAQHGLIVQARPRSDRATGAGATIGAASATAAEATTTADPATGGQPGPESRGSHISPDEPAEVRYGITCSRKVGNAVTRNRARRRLRAAAREILPELGQPGWDYVLIGRAGRTASMPFDRLRADLIRALCELHNRR